MSKAEESHILRVRNLDQWREWLQGNHLSEQVVWLVFVKKREKGTADTAETTDTADSSVRAPLTYQRALDEALCFGWVDSLVKAIDEKEYMRKFTPRKASSTWSEINKRRVEALACEGRMAPAGLRAIEVAKQNGMWEKGVQLPRVDDSLPGALLNAFRDHTAARDRYFAMVPSHQKQYNIWINMARRPETILRRVGEAIRKLERGEEMGLK